MKTCQNCGAKWPDSQKYCEQCGKPLPNISKKQSDYKERKLFVSLMIFGVVLTSLLVAIALMWV